MKMSRFFSIALLGLALVATPVYAQRGGGGGRSGGGSSHSSSGGGRSGGSYSSPSRSSSYSGSSYSSSRSSSSYSSPSRSSSSYSSSSRSSSSYSPSRSIDNYTPSRSSSNSYSRSSSASRSSYTPGSESSRASRTGSVPDQVRSRSNSDPRSSMTTRDGVRSDYSGRGSSTGRVEQASRTRSGNVTNGRPNGVAPANPGYASPTHPAGPMPPSHRPMHPAPYFYHPHHHCMVHCHLLYWDPICYHHYYWPGFWMYCNSYWYDYHVTDVHVVRRYVRDTYKMDLVDYAISGDYMYALVNDPDGHTYIQIYDKNDKLLAEQKVSRKYIKLTVDSQNGGCWIMKKRDKDALLFLYADGQLLIYEAD